MLQYMHMSAVQLRPRPLHLDSVPTALVGTTLLQVTYAVVLGSSDRTFSVWVHGEVVPLAFGKKFFKGGVTDIAWTPGGDGFFVCSYDGSVASVRFEPGELGEKTRLAQYWNAKRIALPMHLSRDN